MRAILCAVVVLVLAGPVAAQDMALSTILIEGEGWKPVAKDLKSVRGLATDREGNLYVADGKRIARIKDGQASTVVETPVEPAGLAFTPDGALLVCLPGK